MHVWCLICLTLSPQNMNGPLRDKAEAIFEARKRQCLQHRKDAQKSNIRISPSNVEPEDKHKEMDRICEPEDKDKEMERLCDTEDAVDDFSSNDEEVGENEETATEYGISYKKLTFYACHTGMGTGVLHTMEGHATGTDIGGALAILSDQVEARWWYSFGRMIQNVSRFWNRCRSH